MHATANVIEIANTIMGQIGGHKMKVMCGVKNVTTYKVGVKFNIGTGAKNGINTVTIELDPSDTYKVTFWKIRGGKVTTVSEHEGIYADMLVELFESKTGFFTKL